MIYDETFTNQEPVDMPGYDLEEKRKKKKKKQIIIEDGTLAAFGFHNPVEVTVEPDRIEH